MTHATTPSLTVGVRHAAHHRHPRSPGHRGLRSKARGVALLGAVVALVGQLGAGKTHLTRAIAEGLGVKNPAAVNSPTFVLIQEYPARLPIYHFDAYRLSGPRVRGDSGPTSTSTAMAFRSSSGPTRWNRHCPRITCGSKSRSWTRTGAASTSQRAASATRSCSRGSSDRCLSYC